MKGRVQWTMSPFPKSLDYADLICLFSRRIIDFEQMTLDSQRETNWRQSPVRSEFPIYINGQNIQGHRSSMHLLMAAPKLMSHVSLSYLKYGNSAISVWNWSCSKSYGEVHRMRPPPLVETPSSPCATYLRQYQMKNFTDIRTRYPRKQKWIGHTSKKDDTRLRGIPYNKTHYLKMANN